MTVTMMKWSLMKIKTIHPKVNRKIHTLIITMVVWATLTDLLHLKMSDNSSNNKKRKKRKKSRLPDLHLDHLKAHNNNRRDPLIIKVSRLMTMSKRHNDSEERRCR